MPFIITDGTTTVKPDATLDAMRASFYPCEAAAWYQITLTSGALTGVAAGTANLVWALRQLDTSLLLVRRIGWSWLTTTGYTAAQYQDFAVSGARSYTVSSSGGTAWSNASNNNKIRTSLAAPTSIDLRIATTAALTAGTYTADSNVFGQQGCNNAAGTAGGYVPMTYVLDQGPGDYPLVLAQNEGIIIYPVTAMGAAGVGTLTVTIEVAQAAAF